MKNSQLIGIFVFAFLFVSIRFATATTGKVKNVEEDSSHQTGKEEKGEHGHEHENKHESEERSEAKNIGPNKGITSFSEEKGFTLSKEATKTFAIETMPITGPNEWTLPKEALVFSGEKTSVYRVHEGYYKIIDVKVVKKQKSGEITFRSDHLLSGDMIVVKGSGFLRVAEIDATSGEVGHSH
jgi:hypothetical protein